jgi:3-oxoacyl-[acyl-carrier protein] reductase
MRIGYIVLYALIISKPALNIVNKVCSRGYDKKNSGRIIYITSMTKNLLKNFLISNTLISGIVALGKTFSIELAPHNITVN